jgi:hypothetical protein
LDWAKDGANAFHAAKWIASFTELVQLLNHAAGAPGIPGPFKPDTIAVAQRDDVVHVECWCNATGGEAMHAQIVVALERLEPDSTPIGIIATTCCCATVSISLLAEVGVVIAIAAAN